LVISGCLQQKLELANHVLVDAKNPDEIVTTKRVRKKRRI